MLWRFFPDEPDAKRDFLFRKEIRNGYPVYYMVSRREPVPVDALFKIETKKYNPKIKKGDKCSFHLRVNPIIAKKEDDNKKSKRHDIWMNAWREGKSKELEKEKLSEYVNTQVKLWLINRAACLGFSVDHNDLVVEGYTRHRFYGNKMKRIVNIGILDYCGVLMIADAEKLNNTLFNGIGKAKAFGCGLLLIKRL